MGEVSLNARLVTAYTAYTIFLFQLFAAPVFTNGVGDVASASNLYVWSTTVNIVSFFALAACAKRLARLSESHAGIVVAGLACSLGAVLAIPTTLSGDASRMAAITASAACTGVGTALLYLGIARAFVRSNERSVVANLLTAFLLGIAANAVLSMFPGPAVAALVAMLPIAATYCLITYKPEQDPVEKQPLSDASRKRLPALIAKFAVMVAVFSLLSGAARGLYVSVFPDSDNLKAVPLVASALIAVVLAWLPGGAGRRVGAVAIYRVVFFFSVVCAAVLASGIGGVDVMWSIQRTVGELLRILLFLFCYKLCMRTNFSDIVVFGLVIALSKLVTAATGAVTGSPWASFPATATVLAIVTAIAFTYLFVFTENDVHELMETSHTVSIREANDARCAAVGRKYKLSARELEVMTLYSQGRTVAAIADMLGLSENTVSMYRRKLYAKLDIHSKQELMGVLEREEQTLTLKQ